jgi:predicted lipid-binding transport protein (Tim44 family)
VKKVLLSLFVVLIAASFVAPEVQARRLGGGATSGMKRQAPPAQPAQTVPAKPADAAAQTPAGATAAAPAAAAPKRSWLGPIAGLAAGLGLAALMSHFGLGAEFGSLLTMLLLAVVGVFVVRFLMRRFMSGAGNRGPAMATPQGMRFSEPAFAPTSGSATSASAMSGSATSGSATSGSAVSGGLPLQQAARTGFPPGFDAAGFERIAKLIFIRMQAANDTADLADLRQFATPEMFATFKLELQERQGAAQQTDVVRLDAQVLEFAQEDDRQIVSVRFHGLIREEKDAPASAFDETWHLTKPLDGSRDWAIAGIAQNVFA